MKSFAQQELKAIAERCAQKVAAVKEGVNYFREPYRHFFVDDFLDKNLAQACLDHFPAPDDGGWEKAKDANIGIKQHANWQSEFDIPEGIIAAVRILNSSTFLKAMGGVLGIQRIMPDPYFTDGGLGVSTRGAVLDVHVDGSYHDATGLNRRISALVYLNPEWRPEWGGEFGVYDGKGEACVRKIPPLFNRLFVFDSNDYSFHGLPDPLNFPAGVARKSIMLYYYTKEPRKPRHKDATGERGREFSREQGGKARVVK